jgi:hypothetical protein
VRRFARTGEETERGVRRFARTGEERAAELLGARFGASVRRFARTGEERTAVLTARV